MRPKGKLFALLAIFAAIGLVTATGAFTSVSATRTVDVQVTGDSAALLQIQGDSDYATNGDTISFDLTGTGLNKNATTNIDDIMNVTNNGDREVHLTVSVTNDAGQAGLLTIYNTTGSQASTTGVTPSPFGGADLSPSDKVDLGFSFDTSNVNTDTYNLEITINATAT